MKTKMFFLIILGALLLLGSFVMIISQDDGFIEMTQGKNNLVFNITDSFSVEKLIKLNPEIEVVSFNRENQSIGYVNIFGGVGENFIIQEGINYEIIAREDFNLVLPYNE